MTSPTLAEARAIIARAQQDAACTIATLLEEAKDKLRAISKIAADAGVDVELESIVDLASALDTYNEYHPADWNSSSC